MILMLSFFCCFTMLKDAWHLKFIWHAGYAGKIITQERFIPMHTITAKLGERFCLCLPALHSLTGCDTTSEKSGSIQPTRRYRKMKKS